MPQVATSLPPHVTESKIWTIGDLTMGHAVGKSYIGSGFSVDKPEDEAVRIHFGLRGDYKFRHRQLGQEFDLIGGHHNMLYSKGFAMEVTAKSAEIETFGIQMPVAHFLEWIEGAEGNLRAFAKGIEAGKPSLLSQNWGRIDLPMEILIRQVMANGYAGRLQEIYLESKAMELIVLSADACEHADRHGLRHIRNERDRAALMAVRDLIHSRLDAPLSLTELAKAVGINSFKLKHGFKELFGEAVIGYATRLRLEWALELLQSPEMQVADIAYRLGYATPGHFGQQFKRHFGCTPNSVRKNP